MFRCPFKEFFGVECPGCGAQRAFLLVLKGEWSQAFALYPAIFTLMILGILILLSIVDKKRSYGKAIFSLTIVNLVIIFGSYLLKIS